MTSISLRNPFSLKILLLALAGLLCGLTAVHVCVSLMNGSQLNHVAGVWSALAFDLSQGVFYRPLVSPEGGFGGTRYLPLNFALQALAFKGFGDLVMAGFAVTVLSAVLFFAGFWRLLWKLGSSREMTLVFSALFLTSLSAQLAMTTIRGDLLPLALNIWGFVACLEIRKYGRGLILAALFFVLAFTAKITACFAVGVAVFWLFLEKRRRQAMILLGLSIMGGLLSVGFFQIASQGRFLESLAACADGGVSFRRFLYGPWEFLLTMWEEDPFVLFLSAFTGVMLVIRPRAGRSLPGVFFLTILPVLLVIFGSPGTGFNQLIDLQAASLLVLATVEREGLFRKVFVPALAVVFAFSFVQIARLFIKDSSRSRAIAVQSVFTVFPNLSPARILSEDPWVPLLAGGPVLVQDPFALRLVRKNLSPDPLLEGLAGHRWDAVILIKNPDAQPKWYRKTHFGEGFAETLAQNYFLAQIIGGYRIYRPKTAGSN